MHECQNYLPRCSDSIIRTQYFPLRYGNDPSLLNTFLFNETSLLNRRHYLTLSSSTRCHSRRRVMTRHTNQVCTSVRTIFLDVLIQYSYVRRSSYLFLRSANYSGPSNLVLVLIRTSSVRTNFMWGCISDTPQHTPAGNNWRLCLNRFQAVFTW